MQSAPVLTHIKALSCAWDTSFSKCEFLPSFLSWLSLKTFLALSGGLASLFAFPQQTFTAACTALPTGAAPVSQELGNPVCALQVLTHVLRLLHTTTSSQGSLMAPLQALRFRIVLGMSPGRSPLCILSISTLQLEEGKHNHSPGWKGPLCLCSYLLMCSNTLMLILLTIKWHKHP